MIDVQVSITPIGTDSTSISDYIAKSEKALEKFPNLNKKITGMSTEIEGSNLNDLFDALKEMHNAQFENGVKRVNTLIRIDERRDKQCTLKDKVVSLKSKM